MSYRQTDFNANKGTVEVIRWFINYTIQFPIDLLHERSNNWLLLKVNNRLENTKRMKYIQGEVKGQLKYNAIKLQYVSV